MTNDTPCGIDFPSPGTKYNSRNESVAARAAKGETELLTDWGLTAPGAEAVFKVYVALTTGNVKGGNAVVVRRPEG